MSELNTSLILVIFDLHDLIAAAKNKTIPVQTVLRQIQRILQYKVQTGDTYHPPLDWCSHLNILSCFLVVNIVNRTIYRYLQPELSSFWEILIKAEYPFDFLLFPAAFPKSF